jgi:hypothetical protein
VLIKEEEKRRLAAREGCSRRKRLWGSNGGAEAEGGARGEGRKGCGNEVRQGEVRGAQGEGGARGAGRGRCEGGARSAG